MNCPSCGSRNTGCFFKDYFDADDDRWEFLFDNECPNCGCQWESIKLFIETDVEELVNYDGEVSYNRRSRR